MVLAPFETASVIVVGAAIAAYLNHVTVKLPQTIALTLAGAVVSLVVGIADRIAPGLQLGPAIGGFLSNVDFKTALLNVMLSFLLFAGALHIDLHELRRGRWLIAVLSTVGVIVSTVVVAVGFKGLAVLFHLDAPFSWCLVFGALISPTDPVAVIALLQRSATPALLKTTVAAESLFNDGVGVVVFTILLGMATSGQAGGGQGIDVVEGLGLFAREALGGAVLGLIIGGIGYVMMRTIEDYVTEALITIALVMGGYTVATPLGVSGPVTMAVAGLVIGNFAVTMAMSAVTRDHLMKFWDLIDHTLNAALFLLIGLQGVALLGKPGYLLIAVAAIPLVLAARAISIGPPLALWRGLLPFRPAFALLTWGGLRGGICIAMALSLPPSPIRDLLLMATYGVVMFSVLIQGLTVERLVAPRGPAPASEERGLA